MGRVVVLAGGCFGPWTRRGGGTTGVQKHGALRVGLWEAGPVSRRGGDTPVRAAFIYIDAANSAHRIAAAQRANLSYVLAFNLPSGDLPMAVAAALAPLTTTEIQQLATNWYRQLDIHAPLSEVTPMLTSKGL